MARVMLNLKKLSKRLWVEALNTACYSINRVYLRSGTKKTLYELWKGKKPNLDYFYISKSICSVLNDREHFGKFDLKSNEGVFLIYSNNSRAFHVYNMRTHSIIESAKCIY